MNPVRRAADRSAAPAIRKMFRFVRPRGHQQRPDVLVYTGDVLREGLELTGPMRAIVNLIDA